MGYARGVQARAVCLDWNQKVCEACAQAVVGTTAASSGVILGVGQRGKREVMHMHAR